MSTGDTEPPSATLAKIFSDIIESVSEADDQTSNIKIANGIITAENYPSEEEKQNVKNIVEIYKSSISTILSYVIGFIISLNGSEIAQTEEYVKEIDIQHMILTNLLKIVSDKDTKTKLRTAFDDLIKKDDAKSVFFQIVENTTGKLKNIKNSQSTASVEDAYRLYYKFNSIYNIVTRYLNDNDPESLNTLQNSKQIAELTKVANEINDYVESLNATPAASAPDLPASPASSTPESPVPQSSDAAPPASAAAPPAPAPALRLQVQGVPEDDVDDNVVSIQAPFDETHNNYYVAGNPTRDLQFLSLPNVPHLQVSAQNSSEYRTLLVQAIGTFPAIPSITGLSKKDDAKRLNCTEWFNNYMSDDTNLPDSNTVAGAYIRSEDKALEKARRDEMIMYICDHDAVAKRIMTNVGDTIRKLLDRALMIPQLLAENARLCACVPTDENPMSARAAPAVEAMKNDQKLLMEQLAYMAMQMKKLSDSLDFAYDPADKTFYRKTIDANDQVKEERWNPETDAAHPILGLDMDKVKELWDVLGSAQTGTLYGQKLSVYPVHLSCAGDLVSTPLIHAIVTYKTERPIATVGANDKITIARMYLLRLFDLIRNLGDKDKIKAVFQAAVNDTVMLEQMSKYITLTSGSIKVWIRLPFDFFKTHAKDVFALFAKNPDTADLIAPKDEDQLISYTNWQLALTSMALRPVNISLSQEFGLDQDPNMQLWMQDIARLPKDGIELAFMSYEELDEREFAEPGIRSALSADDLQLRKMQRQIERELNQKENDAIEEAEIRRVTKDKPDMQQAQLLALQEKIKRRNERQNIVAESVEGYEAALNSLEKDKHVKIVPNLQPLPKTVYDLISMGANFQKDAKELTRVVNKQGFDQQKQADAMTASTEAMQIYNLSKQAKDLMNAFYAAPDSTARKDIVAQLAQILVNVSIAHGKYVSARVVAIPDTTI